MSKLSSMETSHSPIPLMDNFLLILREFRLITGNCYKSAFGRVIYSRLCWAVSDSKQPAWIKRKKSLLLGRYEVIDGLLF